MDGPKKLLILVAMVLVCSSTTTAHSTWPNKWRVDIVNGLSSGQTLFIHCKSKDDDLGIHNLAVGAKFGWNFRDNLWGTTLFWCYMRKPDNANASFEVYWDDKSKEQWLYNFCNWEDCIWTAKDDGIYIKNILGNKDELAHKWG
ncbi:S-protein homolog 1-like [Momordica charantia]|uniref:S-protein homolog n=1 Tax=Momordica charantia TaxID=3673 RepID=A0A6J1CQW3_MOMCH|nr:S-protein homolog 1-like [Momordica charantia]